MDLDRYQQELFSSLFERLDSAFPDFKFRRRGASWQATNRAFTKTLPGNPRPDRVEVSARAPWGFTIHGAGFIPWLRYMNGGARPRGGGFWTALRELGRLAGVPMPEPDLTPEARARYEARDRRTALFEAFHQFTRHQLREGSEAVAGRARRYLFEKRGFRTEDLTELDLGVYPSAKEVSAYLLEMDFSEADLTDSGLVTTSEGKPLRAWDGREVVPWRGRYGDIRTFFARDVSGTAEDGAKYMYLRGSEKGKLPLFGLDEALRQGSGYENLVVVEGLFDVLSFHARGFAPMAALGGAGQQFTPERWSELATWGVRSVTLALDQDEAGMQGLLAALDNAAKADKGINVYVLDPAMLGTAKDPDEFLRLHAGDARPFARLLEKRIHAYRFRAQAIVAKHRGSRGEWSDAAFTSALDEAIAFDTSVKDPARFADLERFFWPPVLEGTGADFDAILARREAIRAREAGEQQRRSFDAMLQEARNTMAAGQVDHARRLLRQGLERLDRQERALGREQIRSIAEELEAHEERLERWRGAEFLGLPQRTIPALDEALSGLRGLMLLAAMPNVGKTALAVQLGLDVIENNPGACFLFLSLEMSRWDMLTRLKCRLARVSWHTLVFGNPMPGHARGRGREVFFAPDELERITAAEKKLSQIGQRMRILDDRNFPNPTVDRVMEQVADLKARTGCSRAFVLIDYLQVWPIPEHLAPQIRTELDADKWRIGAMKTLRDACDGDAILAISEARKPADKSAGWGSSLSDVMGSARGTYTPDVVFLFQAYDDEEIAELHGFGEAPRAGDGKKRRDWEERVAKARERLQEAGVAYSRLIIAKGRDGVIRRTIPLSFHFRESRFEEGARLPWKNRE